MQTGGIVAAVAALLAGLAACSAGNRSAEPVPAVLVSPDADDISEVQRAAAALTGAGQVTLSEDVLTASPELSLDRQIPRSLEGSPAGGRIMDRPPRLMLVKQGGQCLLVRQDTEESEVLAGVSCVPFKAP